MSWTAGGSGVVTNDLTAYAQQFVAVSATGASRPSAYYAPYDDSQHVVYLAQDGHVHDLYWGRVGAP